MPVTTNPTAGGMNTVWPHRGEISYPGEMLGGKELCVYACTSELSGSPDFDSRMAGIGTFCHEFGHVLGWPDFYDTNGSDFGTGVGVFNWSLMCQGQSERRRPARRRRSRRWSA